MKYPTLFLVLWSLLWVPNFLFGQITDTTAVHTQSHLDKLTESIITAYYAGDYVSVMELSPVALEIAKKLGDYQTQNMINSNVGNAFLKLEDTLQGRSIFNDMLKDAIAREDLTTEMSVFIDLGNTYVMSEPEQAVSYFEKVIPIATKLQDSSRRFIAHYNLSELYANEEEPRKLKYHIDEAFGIANALDKDLYTSSCYFILGRYFLLKNDIQQAIENFEKSATMAEEINFKGLILDNYKFHIKALETIQDYEGIYNLRQKYEPLREEKYEADKISQLEIAKAKYNVEEYKQSVKASDLEKQLAEQTASKSKTISYYAVAVIGLLLGILALSYLSSKKRKKLLKDLRDKNHKYLVAKEKSEQLTKAKSKFFSTVSHELRTPLYGIIGLSNSLLEENEVKALDSDIRTLKFSADYLLALINDVLQLNKLDDDTGKKLEKQPFSLVTLIQNIMTSFEFMREKNDNVFDIFIAPEIPELIEGDALKLSQILINLIGNACKFTENGKITITVTTRGIEGTEIPMHFKIQDTGVGIPEDKQKEIFEEFTQGKTKSPYAGTGLGLSIVKKLLTLFGSSLHMKSKKGIGTTMSFDITFNTTTQKVAATQTPLSSSALLENKSVLIVDDNRINQIVTQKIVEKLKMNFVITDNGKDAVDLATKGSFDIILMDLNMPIMDGFEATRRLRELGNNKPIIALTAVELDEAKDQIYACGINDIIIKPYEQDVFKETLLKNITTS